MAVRFQVSQPLVATIKLISQILRVFNTWFHSHQLLNFNPLWIRNGQNMWRRRKKALMKLSDLVVCDCKKICYIFSEWQFQFVLVYSVWGYVPFTTFECSSLCAAPSHILLYFYSTISLLNVCIKYILYWWQMFADCVFLGHGVLIAFFTLLF